MFLLERGFLWEKKIHRGFPGSWSRPKSRMFGSNGSLLRVGLDIHGWIPIQSWPRAGIFEILQDPCADPRDLFRPFPLGIAPKSQEIQSRPTNSTEFLPNRPRGGKTKRQNPQKTRMKAKIKEFRAGIQPTFPLPGCPQG